MATPPRQTTGWLDALLASGRIRIQRGALLDRVPDRTPRAWDRVEGMLLGLAVGDALGNTSEGQSPAQRRARHGEIRHYLPNYKSSDRCVGLPSDDTQLAFWTLEQAIEDGGYDPEALARKFASNRIFGIGSSVSQFVHNFKDQGFPWHEAGPESAGNGALMRIAPVLVPHQRQPTSTLWADAALAAMTTHNDTASIASCVAFVAMLWDLLGMEVAPPPEWWLETFVAHVADLELPDKVYRPRGGRFVGWSGRLSEFLVHHVFEAEARVLPVVDACNEWYSGAYLLETVPSVLYILMRYGHDPEEAIVRAVNDTYDNDTIAAVVGAAVGALHGTDGLPRRWRDGLLGRTRAADDGRVFELIAEAREHFGPA
jgi:ADP-ribosylglycohydrolase